MNAQQVTELDCFEFALRKVLDNAEEFQRGAIPDSPEAWRQAGKAAAYHDVLTSWTKLRSDLVKAGGAQ